jgi:23S rRNA pseudouridine2605 synthase
MTRPRKKTTRKKTQGSAKSPDTSRQRAASKTAKPAQRKKATSKKFARSKPASSGQSEKRQKPDAKEPVADKPEKPVRVQVLLAKCGFGSRRACEEFISEGRVKVDGELAVIGCQVTRDSFVMVDDEPIKPNRKAYYMLNKPKGMLCTNNDPNGRPRIVDLFPPKAGRLFPVGRLDENTVGLLIVTNDGELSHQLAHPKFEVPKIYRVHVAGVPNHETLKKMREGMYFSDGKFKVENIKRISAHGKSAVLEVTLKEGQNREVRRLFARVGHKVMKLERISFGPLHLRSVGPGKFRALTQEEVKLLRDYIDNRDKRVTDDRLNRPKKQQDKKTRKRAQRTTIEVEPIEGIASHDLTGQRRRPRPERRKAPDASALSDSAERSAGSDRAATSARSDGSTQSDQAKKTHRAKSNHPAIAKPRKQR